jgi:dihydropyrimidinase
LFNYGVEKGRITPERFVELTSTGPAKMVSMLLCLADFVAEQRYGQYPKKGGLLPGLSDADLVIWYPKGRMDAFGLLNEHLHHNTDCE